MIGMLKLKLEGEDGNMIAPIQLASAELARSK